MNKIIVILSLLLISACSSNVQEYVIADVTKSELIILNSKETNPPHSININGIGNVTGDAKITLMLNDKPYKTETIKGDVNFNWGSDWYDTKVIIKYETKNITTGSLKLRYSFVTN